MLKLILGTDPTDTASEKDSLIPTAVTVVKPDPPPTDNNNNKIDMESLKQMEKMQKELSEKLDKLHTREFRKNIIQPILFLVVLCFLILCYYFFPFGLFVILVFCFVFAWTFPALHIPLWISIVLLVFLGYRFVTGTFTWTWLPRQG